ncbi:MAG: ABC transporter ATP-binding protein [Candidatus Treponema excrementipullorum]|uniref:ABC transporter ATP-binding protein n=1 Tax=Candidatus Treponema excrementipullorum TaxID=2838768 RepID=A0A9E2P0H6_9SPIR|nr:ABC transporter ATP-binding protein [Candidatus Treponema excrementipullorum]
MEKDISISFENFGFQYVSQAEPTLYDINLTIYKGEKILIAGPSGCGKSTLGHCINGLIPASYPGKSTGTLTVGGLNAAEEDLSGLSKVVGTVLQDTDGQFIGLTVAEDIAFALENDCMETEEIHKTVEKVARLVDVDKVLKHAPYEISGGQKQRVSLGGVMVNDVDILLFDEPLANLDPATGKQAVELIDDIQKRTGCTVVIIEHRLEDVLHRPVDRIVLMEEGRIVYDGTPDVLLTTDLLPQKGIREPLYVTALKYAGVKLEPAMHPDFLPELQLSDHQRQQVFDWFSKQPPSPADEKTSPLLQIKNLDFAYNTSGTKVLKDITLTINKGEMLSIVGTNGAGKSTFSKVVCGFVTPQCGSLTFDGMDLQNLSIKERADHIGYVMQNPNQMISKNFIFDEVAFGLVNRGFAMEEIERRVEDALTVCGLRPFKKWPVSALSYGQKKRVTIASMLVLEPEMLILDEPTAGQDFRHYTEIMDFLSQLNKRGMTVVLITHDMHLMLEYTPRAVVFNDGRIIADASSAEVLNSLEIVEKAHLKETSLYYLSKKCNIQEPEEFTKRFIAWDKEVRTNG